MPKGKGKKSNYNGPLSKIYGAMSAIYAPALIMNRTADVMRREHKKSKRISRQAAKGVKK
jgi:hypothetical protein